MIKDRKAIYEDHFPNQLYSSTLKITVNVCSSRRKFCLVLCNGIFVLKSQQIG